MKMTLFVAPCVGVYHNVNYFQIAPASVILGFFLGGEGVWKGRWTREESLPDIPLCLETMLGLPC